MSEEEYIEHEIVDRLYYLEEKDFDKTKVEDSYIQAVIKAGKENKKLVDKLQKNNYNLDRENQHFFDRIQDLQKQLDQLKEVDKQICNEELITKDKYQEILKENEELHKQVDIEFVEENYIEKSKVISKNKIRDKIKEIEERDKMFKLELPEDVTIYQYGIEVLKELLGE